MAMFTDTSLSQISDAEGLAFAREVLRGVQGVGSGAGSARRLDHEGGRPDLPLLGGVIVAGMGKAGLVGQKLAATLASTGTRAFPLHPAEAVHGDLGRIRTGDVVIALSQSGETYELLRAGPGHSPPGGPPGRDHRRRVSAARSGGRPLHRTWGPSRKRARSAWPLSAEHHGAHGRGGCPAPS